MLKNIILPITLLIFCSHLAVASNLSGDYRNSTKAKRFISKMVKKNKFDRNHLNKIFSNAKFKADILAKYKKPKKSGVAEAGSWLGYKKIMLTKKRRVNGIAFWKKYKNTLARAQRIYGVPPEYIVAILGVETYYGEKLGKHRVIDALSTMAFTNNKRAKFFTSELKNFLLMTKKEKKDPLKILGSYSGAMGYPQFMPSSFRQYAVDFNKDGKRNLWQAVDSIGSIANYLKKRGWRKGENVAVPAAFTGRSYKKLPKGQKTNYSLSRLKKYGITPRKKLNSSRKSLIRLREEDNAVELWLGGRNFYVITKYNNSAKYAMTVYKLAQQIKKGR